MIIHTDTTRFIYEVLEQGEYSFLFKNYSVLDVGCNIGAFSLYMQPMAKHIHAVDVSTECIEHFNDTIKDNKYENITTYSLAIAGKTGKRMVTRDGEPLSGGWRIDIPGDLEVDAYTLNDFMIINRIPHIDVLKLDVEGAEAEIVQAKDFPRNKINTIIGESHSVELLNQVNIALRSYGFTIFDVDGSHFLARK